MTVVDDFHRLHDDFLLLPNAWDAASGTALAGAAVGMTSLGVAAVAGLTDGAGLARAQTVALFRAGLGAALHAARAVRDGAPLTREITTYQQVQRLW